MGFWKKNGYPYLTVIEISKEELLLLSTFLSREDIIEWLMWNDPNGVYDDEQSLKEFGNKVSKEEALEIFFRQVEENRLLKSNLISDQA